MFHTTGIWKTHPKMTSFIRKECLKWLLKKTRKCYDLKYKLDAVKFGEINSDEKAAKKLTLR